MNQNIHLTKQYKSDKEAIASRKLGNEKFEKGEMHAALMLYNKSISYANSKDVISLSYANRSAVYFAIKRYGECLENIELARENGYPKDKLAKLNEREKKCKKLIESKMTDDENPWKFFQLSYPANEKIPWLVDCVEVRETEKYGRGIYAKKDLKAGDIVCIEKPVIALMGEDVSTCYMHCYNCLKTRMMNLIPSTRSALMMFCSTACMEDFHIKTRGFEFVLCNNVKIISELAAAFGGKKNFDDFVKQTDLNKLKKTIFDYDLSNPDDVNYQKNLMICYLSLARKGDIHSDDVCLVSKTISKKLTDHISDIQYTNHQDSSFTNESLEMHEIGINISLFSSLINHSCIPNVRPVCVDDKIVTMVIKPIKAGDQLFQCYFDELNPLWFLAKIPIMIKHRFECDCKSCKDKNFKKYPLCMNQIPDTFMKRNYFVKAEEFLKEGWHYLNSKSSSQLENAFFMGRNYSIIETLAYFCTYPC